MDKFTSLFALAAAMLTFGTATAQKHIPIQEDKPVLIYALGAGSPKGVYRINPSDLGNMENLTSGTDSWGVQYTGSSAGGGGTFLSEERVVGIRYNYSAYAFDATAAGNEYGPWGASYALASSIYKMWDMTYEESTGTIYCWYGYKDYDNYLGTYDPATKTVNRIGSAENTFIYGLAIDAEGQLWGVGRSGAIYKVDKTTGVATQQSYTTSVKVDYTKPVSACFDFSSGVCYLSAARDGWLDSQATLWSIDMATGTTTSMGQFSSGFYNCLWIPGSTLSTDAPAEVENLTAEFNGETTVVSFTAPTVSIGGSDLSGELTYTINVDGVESATGTVQPGADVAVNIDAADGKHQIQVSVANGEGSSKVASVEVFSGYDQPGNITDLKAVLDDNTVTLTWVAPKGVNDGMVNMAKLRYKVSHDGEVLAENLETTEYVTTVSGNYKRQSYTVTVVYDATDGQSATASVMAGAPYEIPYTLDLAGATTPADAGITTLNNVQGQHEANHYNRIIWSVATDNGDPCLQSYTDNNSESGNYYYRLNFAYLPPVEFKAGVKYTMRFDAAAFAVASGYGNRQNDLKVLIAKTPTEAEGEYTELQTVTITSVYNKYEWTEAVVDFSVDADGVYYLGILDTAEPYTNNSRMTFKNLSIVANFTTPEAVGDLSAKVEGHNVELSYTLPTLDIEGAQLSGLSKVEISRDGELIATIDEALTPGEAMTYADEDVAEGYHTYSVVVYNGDKVSDPATLEVTVGHAKDLAITTVAAPAEVISPAGEGSVTVKVSNEGFEAVEAGAYTVALYCGEQQVATEDGKALAAGESAEYTLSFTVDAEIGTTVEYTAKVLFEGDEVADNDESETYSVKVAYAVNLAIETVIAPDETVFANTTTSIVVKVTNTGNDEVAADAYKVVLYANGEATATEDGETLASEASKEYTFDLDWAGERPTTIEYCVKVVCESDENADDDATETYSVAYDITTGIGAAGAGELSITAHNGVIVVKGAAGAAVSVYTVDGRVVATAEAADELTTPALSAGVYVVAVGNKVVKIAL